MTAAVVAHGGANAFGQLVQLGNQQLGRLAVKRRALDGGNQVVDVGLMVLGVVNLHRPRVNMRLQRIVGIGQGRQGVAHGWGLSFRLKKAAWAGKPEAFY